jgi:hypothetical protein
LALGDRVGKRPFFVNPTMHANNSLLPRPTEGRRYYPREAELERTITVQVTTLDQYCRDQRIDHINVLKMDAQGAELLIIKGADEMLRRGAIDLIYCELLFIPHYEECALFDEIVVALRSYGFSLYNLYDTSIAANGQLSFGDAILLSERLRKQVVDEFPPEP